MIGDQIRRVYYLMGFKDDRKSCQIKPMFTDLIMITLFIDSYICFIYNKIDNDQNTENNILLVKNIDILFTQLGFSFNFILFKDDMSCLLEIIDKKFSKYDYDFQDKQKLVISDGKQKQQKVLDRTVLLLVLVVSPQVLIPFFTALYIIFIDKGVNNIDVSTMPMPFLVWYPEGFDTILIYTTTFAMQVIFMLYLVGHVFCIYGTMVCSIQSILIDINLLCIDIDEIDKEVISIKYDKIHYEKELKKYSVYLIKSHRNIFRDVKRLNKALSLVSTLDNQCICIQICVFLYGMSEADNMLMVVFYAVASVVVAIILFIKSFNGQQVINASENLRRSLYMCPWVDKPIWFKKHLIVMMSMANTPLHVKPFGLYVLDLDNYTNMINAAYSYFNVLRNAKK